MKELWRRLVQWRLFGSIFYRKKIKKREELFDWLYSLYAGKVISLNQFKFCITRDIDAFVNGYNQNDYKQFIEKYGP